MHYLHSNYLGLFPSKHETKVEKNREIQTDIINLETRKHGSVPKYHLVGRWPTIRHFLHIGGWIHHQAILSTFLLLSNIYFGLLFSLTRQHLRCNLLFGLIRHFGLLKDINISFFLSLSLSLQSNHKFFTVILVWFCIILFSAINTCQFLVQFVMFANLLLPSTLLLTSI